MGVGESGNKRHDILLFLKGGTGVKCIACCLHCEVYILIIYVWQCRVYPVCWCKSSVSAGKRSALSGWEPKSCLALPTNKAPSQGKIHFEEIYPKKRSFCTLAISNSCALLCVDQHNLLYAWVVAWRVSCPLPTQSWWLIFAFGLVLIFIRSSGHLDQGSCICKIIAFH